MDSTVFTHSFAYHSHLFLRAAFGESLQTIFRRAARYNSHRAYRIVPIPTSAFDTQAFQTQTDYEKPIKSILFFFSLKKRKFCTKNFVAPLTFAQE